MNDLFGRVSGKLLRFTINAGQYYINNPKAVVDGDKVILESSEEFKIVIDRMESYHNTYNTTIPITGGIALSNHDLIAIEIISQSGDLYQFYENWQA